MGWRFFGWVRILSEPEQQFHITNEYLSVDLSKPVGQKLLVKDGTRLILIGMVMKAWTFFPTSQIELREILSQTGVECPWLLVHLLLYQFHDHHLRHRLGHSYSSFLASII
jgi:hypothetical protein